MLIVCPQCAASYEVAPESLGDDGRSVRCASCHTIWFAAPVQPAMASAVFPPAADNAGTSAFDAPAFSDPAHGAPPAPADMSSGHGDGEASQFHDVAAADITVMPGGQEPEMGDAPSIVPPIEDAGADLRYATPLPGEDIESLAARRERERAQRSLWRKLKLTMPNLATLVVLLGGVVLVLLAARDQVVRYAPQTASFYALIGLPVNLRGLDFENIRVTREIQDGVPVLVVEGKIVSTTKGIAEVPRMRFAIHDQSGKEIYSWTMMPSRTLLASGETLPFRSRLASPPAEGRDVSIRFFNRRDAMSGFR